MIRSAQGQKLDFSGQEATSVATSVYREVNSADRPATRIMSGAFASTHGSGVRYYLHDRDHAFSELGATAKAMGIEEVVTAPHAPWQNPFVERFVGSARRECFDHVIAFNEAGVRTLMTLYGSYYEKARTHLALDKDAPIPRPVMPRGQGDIVAIPEVGGLHHRYERRAA